MGESKVREEAVCCTGMQAVNYHITTADGVCVCVCVCVCVSVCLKHKGPKWQMSGMQRSEPQALLSVTALN